MAGSTSPSTDTVRRSCWNTMRIRRPRSSRPRCFNGPGSNRRSSGSIIPTRADQFNSIHERLIGPGKNRARDGHLHLTGTVDNLEDAARWTISRTPPRRPALPTTLIDIAGHRHGATTATSSISTTAHRARLQALSLGMDVSRCVWRAARRHADAMDRTALEGHPFQQGNSAAAVGDVSASPEFAAGLFRGRSEPPLSSAPPIVRKPMYSREGANVALVSGGVTLAEQQGPYGAEGFVRQAYRAAAEFFRSVSGARQLAGRPHRVRTVDPRGRESDHRQHVAVPAARDLVKRGITPDIA